MSLRACVSAVAVIGLLWGCASTSGGGSGMPGGMPGTPGGAPSSGLPDTGTGAPSLPSPTSAPGAPSLPSSTEGDTQGRRDGSAEGETSGGKDGAAARTAEERRAEIDAKLDASLGGFDATLGKEQQATAQQRDARRAGRGDGTAEEAGTEETGGGDEVSRDRSGDLRSEGATKTAQDGEPGTGAPGAAMPQGGGGAAAKAIPSGEDDDIIARRLRKAAEQETDPELKEKLWNEYRDYKQNTRGGGN